MTDSEDSGTERASLAVPDAAGAAGSRTPGAWLTPGRFALFLAALIFAAFPQVVLGLQTFVVRDFGFFAYPLAYYQRECFWRGHLPFWDPYNNCGVPFLAQWNTMPLYPPALLYLLLPLGWSLSFFCLLHLFFAGLGMYYLARRWTGNFLAAAFAGLIFSFNGLSLNLLMWPSHIATLSWLPWVVLSVEAAWREGGRKVILAALLGAMQMLAGGPETILFTWLLVAALFVSDLFSHPRLSDGKPLLATRAKRALRLAVVILLVAGLAAVQLLPFLDLVAHSQRSSGYADCRWSLPGWGWANFLVPMVFGHVWSMGVFYQYEQSWTSSYYLGVGTLLLGLLAVCCARERRVRLLAAAGGVALLLAFGDQVLGGRWLRELVPQLSFMTYPVKFVTVVAFVAPLLAAFGLSRLTAQPGEHAGVSRARLLFASGALLAMIAAILIWAWNYPFATDNFPATLRNGLSRAIFLLLVAGVLLLLRTRPLANGAGAERSEPPAGAARLRQRSLPALLLLLAWVDVWTHEPNQNPSVQPLIYEPGLARTKLDQRPQPALGISRAKVSPFAEVKLTQFIMTDPGRNYLVKRLGYFADCNLLDGVPKVNGFFSLYPRECGELTSVLYGSTNASFPHLDDFLGVSQSTEPGKVFDWLPRATCLPLITAGQQSVFLDDTNVLRSMLRADFDGRARVFLPPEARPLVTVTNRAQAAVSAPRFEAEQVEFGIEAAEPALAVLSQTYYHAWRAYVDDQPVPLLRANYAFQAVQVPAGSHRVRLKYEDRAFRFGAGITALAGLLCLAGALRGRKRGAQPG